MLREFKIEYFIILAVIMVLVFQIQNDTEQQELEGLHNHYSLRFTREANHYVQIADDNSLEGFTAGVTVCVWAKPNFSTGEGIAGYILENRRYRIIMANWGAGVLICNETGQWGKWAGESTTFTAGNWYFLAGRYDVSIQELRMFLNAEPYDTESQSGAVYSTFNDHFIGWCFYDPILNFDGDISWFAVYNRPLSNAEISYTMLNYDNPITDGLRLLLTIDEGAGLTNYDQSGYGNDGTITPDGGVPPSWVHIEGGKSNEDLIAAAVFVSFFMLLVISQVKKQ